GGRAGCGGGRFGSGRRGRGPRGGLGRAPGRRAGGAAAGADADEADGARGAAGGAVSKGGAEGPEPWRFELAERFDLLPGKGLRWMARVMHYGYVGGGGRSDWQNLPLEGNKAPLAHALRHATEALDLPAGSMARVWKLAK